MWNCSFPHPFSVFACTATQMSCHCRGRAAGALKAIGRTQCPPARAVLEELWTYCDNHSFLQGETGNCQCWRALCLLPQKTYLLRREREREWFKIKYDLKWGEKWDLRYPNITSDNVCFSAFILLSLYCCAGARWGTRSAAELRAWFMCLRDTQKNSWEQPNVCTKTPKL